MPYTDASGQAGFQRFVFLQEYQKHLISFNTITLELKWVEFVDLQSAFIYS